MKRVLRLCLAVGLFTLGIQARAEAIPSLTLRVCQGNACVTVGPILQFVTVNLVTVGDYVVSATGASLESALLSNSQTTSIQVQRVGSNSVAPLEVWLSVAGYQLPNAPQLVFVTTFGASSGGGGPVNATYQGWFSPSNSGFTGIPTAPPADGITAGPIGCVINGPGSTACSANPPGVVGIAPGIVPFSLVTRTTFNVLTPGPATYGSTAQARIAVNQAPTATNGTLTTNEDTAGSGTLVGADADGNPLTYAIVAQGTKGTAVITNPATGAYTYTPTANANGADSFTFKVNDGAVDSNTATVNVTITPVNDAPAATNGTLTTNEDTAANSSLVGADVDGNPLTFAIVVQGTKGTAVITNPATGAYTYTPNADANGADSFTFRATDGPANSNIATVSVTITPVNDAPTAANGTLTTNEDTAGNGALVGADVDGNPLTFAIVAQGTKGTAVINPATGAYTYTPTANANGADSFTFKVNDGTVDSNTAAVSVTITPVNDAPTAANGTLTTTEDTAGNGTLVGADADGNPLAYTIVAQGTKGTAVITNPATGSYTYTPAANANGADSFTFKVNDGTVDSNIATVNVTITPVSDPPTISDTLDQKIEPNATLGPLAITVGDAETAPGSLTLSGSSSNPTLVPNANITFGGSGANRTVTVVPATNQIGTTTITVQVSDGTLTAMDTFVLTVEPSGYPVAEGATGAFFDFDLLVANPNNVPVQGVVTFFREAGPADGAAATVVAQNYTFPATSRTTIHVDDIPGLETGAISARVAALNGLPLIVERTMFWDRDYYGGHTGTALLAPGNHWLFGEGSQGFFDTYVLLVNMNASAANVRVTFLMESGTRVIRDYAVPPTTRFNIFAGGIPQLVNQSFSIVIDSDAPISAERAMYFGQSRLFEGGHVSAGSPAPATTWFHPEGATGDYFETYILVGNPNSAPATVTLTYLLESGQTIVKTKLLPANTRLTINLRDEDPAMRQAAVATQITSTLPVISEQSLYWPGRFTTWHEGNNSNGATAPALKWGLAEGEVGGPLGFETYILLANPNASAATVDVTFLRSNGTTLTKRFSVAARSRFNLYVNSMAPELVNEEFGAVVQSVNGVGIVVQRSMFWNSKGVIWAGGTSALGTPIP